jgi:ergothioneine biosynthesis protein EgtB
MTARCSTTVGGLDQRLSAAREVTDNLFRIVRTEALYERPIAERHRIVFYIGHVEAFDWNLLTSTLFEAPGFNPGFDKLFAFGIDPIGGGLPSDRATDWPTLTEIDEYARRGRETIDRALGRLAAGSVDSSGKREQILNVAIEHRLMHAETLAYMFHWLPPSNKIAVAGEADLPAAPSAAPEQIAIPAGAATLGRHTGFGWDNEFAEHTVEAPAFAIDKNKVTNGQYLEFLRAGGYSDRALWAASDWEWKEANNVEHPEFWAKQNGNWLFRTMLGERPLPLNWPVYVSQAEASAYASWAGKRLPAEVEFHRAAYGTVDGSERDYPWGDEEPAARHGNFDFRRWDPMPVGAHPAGNSAFGVSDLVGNGWEWTATPFAPFPGFEAFSFYRGYSADFFDGKHYVIKGASMRTASSMLRRSFRNWFHGHYPHIYAGFRCVSH